MKDSVTLFYENIRLAYHTAQHYNQQVMEKEDAQQHALLGLWKACKTFDSTRRINFSTYAVTCIKNEIRMAIRKYIRRYKNTGQDVHYDDPIPGQDGLTFLDTLFDPTDYEDEMIESELWNNVITLVKELPEKEQLFIKMYYFNNYTQKEMSQLLNISRQSVYYTIKKAIRKIKDKYIAKYGGIL